MLFWCVVLMMASMWMDHGTFVTGFALSQWNSATESFRRGSRTVPFAARASSSSSEKEGHSEDWFQQRRGESDINFIKRLTSQAPPVQKAEPTTTSPPITKGYQRIEDWEAEQEMARKNGTMTWEQRVQFDGLRNGNQIRQNDILMRQINSGF